MLAPTETLIRLPTLHPGQVLAYKLPGRFKVVRCGRRWGKTKLGAAIATNAAIKQRLVGWFAPNYKYVAEAYREIEEILDPIKKNASRDGVYTTKTGGRIDFWSLDDERAGRSRRYHHVVIDEAAYTKDTMIDVWERSIRPTLLDFVGTAMVISNTNGSDPKNFMWQVCNNKELGFVEYHAPSANNPYLPKEELGKLQAENAPLVYQQEYLAEFVDWSGNAFFSWDKLLVDDRPVEPPTNCDAVFAVIDSATKTGTANDGTGVIYCAVSRHVGHPLTILDWDVKKIEGALLETWLPTVFQQLEHFAKKCGARRGSVGAWIEDKSSGMVLIQQAVRRGWPARAIDSKLTSVGKDERAISVSGYVYRGAVKIAVDAHDKVTTYDKITRNQLRGQVVGFRVGDKDAARRADDLLDCFTYSIALSLGNWEGF